MAMKTLAIVLPCYNEADGINESHNIIFTYLNKLINQNIISPQSFLCYVDDGSSDDTWKLLEDIADGKNIKAVKFSRNYGHQYALLGGIQASKDLADCIVTMDADIQDDYTQIENMVKHYENGCEIVFGVKEDRTNDPYWKRIIAAAFYKFAVKLDIPLIYNHADFRLFGKKALNALSYYRENRVFLRGIARNLGFKTVVVKYALSPRRAGVSKFPLIKQLKFALTGIFSFSKKPLEQVWIVFAAMLGFSVLAFLKFVFGRKKSESSGIFFILFSGLINTLILSIQNEYIMQIFDEVKNRPRFIIEKEI